MEKALERGVEGSIPSLCLYISHGGDVKKRRKGKVAMAQRLDNKGTEGGQRATMRREREEGLSSIMNLF